jgi:phosphatidylinositol alpha-1,6-mannosyltransferase
LNRALPRGRERPLRILLDMADALMVTSSFLPGRGGIESYLAELCMDLSPRLAVLAAARREGRDLPEGLGYPTMAYPGSMVVPSRKALKAIVRAARELGTDRILFGTPWPLILLGPRLQRAGLRYAAVVHGAELLVPAALPLLRRRLAEALSRAELLLPVSRFTAESVTDLLRRRDLPLPRMELLRARIDLHRFRPDRDTDTIKAKLGLGIGDRPILFFSRLIKRKGAHRLIDALDEIAAQVPGAVVVIAGTGPEERSLRQRAARHGRRVLFAGRVPEADVPALYAAAEVFVFPVVGRLRGLDVEGLGVVLLEASACETPCITGRSGGTPEAVIDGKTGYVIDGRERSQIVERTVHLLHNPHLAERMGRAARKHVAREFSKRSLPDALLEWLA